MFRSYSDHLQGALCSLLKSLILKFVKNVKVSVVMRQHNIWFVCVSSVWRCVLDFSTHLHTERTHTHQMLCCRITTL